MIKLAVVAALVVCVFVWLHISGERRLKRQKAILPALRVNPTYNEFAALLNADCEPDIADQLWCDLLPFYAPDMTPHPDDDVIQDMPIDHDEPNDWLRDFCKKNGFGVRDVTPWPSQQQATVRNLARWFSENRQWQQLKADRSAE